MLSLSSFPLRVQLIYRTTTVDFQLIEVLDISLKVMKISVNCLWHWVTTTTTATATPKWIQLFSKIREQAFKIAHISVRYWNYLGYFFVSVLFYLRTLHADEQPYTLQNNMEFTIHAMHWLRWIRSFSLSFPSFFHLSFGDVNDFRCSVHAVSIHNSIEPEVSSLVAHWTCM